VPRQVAEAELTDITCQGFRVTETGLPPSDAYEVKVYDPDHPLPPLQEIPARSDAHGRLDVQVRQSLAGLFRVDVEVELVRGKVEYAETGRDLRLPCSPRSPTAGGTSPSLNTHRPTGYRRSSRHDLSWLPIAIAVVAGLGVGAWLVLRGRRAGTHH
jgi:hypothetical protein